MSVHLSLSSIIIITHVWYASILIIIDVYLVIFQNGAWIVLGSNTINEKLIPPPLCRGATPSHKRAMTVASSLWLTFVNKRRGGVHSVADVDPVRRGVLSASFFLGHQDGLEFHVIVLSPT